jgi:hypothetical protein
VGIFRFASSERALYAQGVNGGGGTGRCPKNFEGEGYGASACLANRRSIFGPTDDPAAVPSTEIDVRDVFDVALSLTWTRSGWDASDSRWECGYLLEAQGVGGVGTEFATWRESEVQRDTSG